MTATDKHPKSDVELSDGVHTVYMMLTDARGRNDPLAIQRNPYPRTSTKINTGGGKYDDLELPYKTIVQDNWIGGRASLNLEDDTTRYMDSFRAWTDQEKQICCGPQETYCTSPRTVTQSIPGKMNWQQLTTNNYLAHKFTASADWTASGVMLWVKYTGTPTNLIVEIWTDSGGSPDAILAAGNTSTLVYSTVGSTISQLRYFEFTTAAAIDGTPATDYWIVVRVAANSTWYVGVNPDAATDTKYSTDGAAWSANAKELYYRIIDNSTFNLKFFEYKRALYAVQLHDVGVKIGTDVYINGDRGAADSNAGALDTLIDATKTWTNDEWIGCTVLIIRGPGFDETHPWRTITDNDGTTLTVSPAWEQTHTTATEYIILGSDKWSVWASTVATSTTLDVAVADEMVYFAHSNALIQRYNERNVAGVWTISYDYDRSSAEKLLAINQSSEWVLWGSLSNDSKNKTTVWKANVPKAWSDSSYLYTEIAQIEDTKSIWDEQTVANISSVMYDNDLFITIAAGFTTGVICTKAIPITDFTKSKDIGLYIKSSVAMNAGDLKLIYDDTPMCLHHYIPDVLLHYDTEVLPSKLYHFKSEGRPTLIYVYDDSETTNKWSLAYNGRDNNSTYSFKATLDTGDFLYISFDQPTSKIHIDLGTAVNSNASDLTAEIYNGEEWTALTAGWSDGTESPAGTSLAQDGDISWTFPNTWNPGCTLSEATYLPSDRWHLRLKTSALLDSVEIKEITCYGNGVTEFPEAERWVDMASVREDSNTSYLYTTTFYAGSSIYIAYPKRFNRVKFNLVTLNGSASTMTGKVWNGATWATLTAGWTDGTLAGGTDTLGQDGDVIFTMPTTWQPGGEAWINSVIGSDVYILKLEINATTDTVTIQNITLEDDALIETFRYISLDRSKDGDTGTWDYITLTADDWIYIQHSQKFNKIIFDIDTTVNNNEAAMSYQYFDGSIWKALTFTASNDGTRVDIGGGHYATLGQDGEMTFSIPYDWMEIDINNQTGYAIRFAPSADLDQVKVVGVEVGNDNKISKNFPALTANQWHWVEIDIAPDSLDPDETQIISIGLYLNADKGAQTISINGGIHLLGDRPKYITVGSAEENIISLESYGDERSNPWVFTDSRVYEIQTQNDDAVVPIPLREITALRSELNGKAHTVSNIYLVFNLGAYIEQYYQHNMDDIGPNKEEGLPANRQGNPTKLLSYPGRLLLSIDANSTGYSSILLRQSGGWHEIYRAPYSKSITDMIIQVIPGMSTRLWFSQGSDVVWLPLPTDTWNPKNDSKFRYTHESVLTTGWINAGFLDILKLWKSVKTYTENLSGTNQFIKCEYQTEDGDLDTSWTAITDVFDTSPFEEQTLNATYTVTARRIRFRFILQTTSNLESPILKATIFETLLRFPVKYSYIFSYRLEDVPEYYTGVKDNTLRAEEQAAILDTWADAPTVLTMTCNYSPFDNKLVVIEPYGLKPLQIDPDAQFEKHIGQISLLGV